MREGAAQLSASEERRQAAAGTVRAGTHNERALEAGARLLRGELCRGRCGGPDGANEQEAKHRGRRLSAWRLTEATKNKQITTPSSYSSQFLADSRNLRYYGTARSQGGA